MVFSSYYIIHINSIPGGLFAVWKDLTEMLAAEYELSDVPNDEGDVIVTPEMVSAEFRFL